MNKALDAWQPYADEIERTNGDFADIARSSLVLGLLLRGTELTDRVSAKTMGEESKYVWVDVLPRSLRPGDVVRVKEHAYPRGSAKYLHNGMEGTVQAIRSGVLVNYTGRAGIGIRHEAAQLERRVPAPSPKHRGEE